MRSGFQFGEPRWSPDSQFRFEMRPLVIQLSPSDFNRFYAANSGYFCYVETVTPPGGFDMNGLQIGGNRFQGRWRVTEANKLGMVGVTACLPPKDCLCQQGFTPERDEAANVQVFRMKCPKAH